MFQRAKRFLYVVLLPLFFYMQNSSSLTAFEVKAYPYVLQKNTGLRVFFRLTVQQQKEIDQYQIFINNQKALEINIPQTPKELERKIKNAAHYSKEFQLKDTSSLFEAIQNRESRFLFLAAFDDDLAEIFGLGIGLPTNVEKGELQIILLKNKSVVDQSEKLNFRLSDLPKIEAVNDLNLISSTELILAQWNPPSSTEIVGYNVYLRKNLKEDWQLQNPKIIVPFETSAAKAENSKTDKNKLKEKNYALQFQIKSLQKNQKYYVTVRSVHLNKMESEKNNEAMAITEENSTPTPPQLVKVFQLEKNSGARIEWQKNPEADILFYSVYRSYSLNGSFSKISPFPLPPNVLVYEDKSIQEYDKKYFYRITATSKGGKTSAMSAAMFFQGVKEIAPSRVKIHSLKSGTGSILVTIQAASEPILRYEVFRSNSQDGPFVKIGSVGYDAKRAQAEYLDKNLRSDSLYCYKIQTMDLRGNLSEGSKVICDRPKNSTTLAAPLQIHSYLVGQTICTEWQMEDHPLLIGFWIYIRTTTTATWQKVSSQPLAGNERRYCSEPLSAATYEVAVSSLAQNHIEGSKGLGTPVTVEDPPLPTVQNIVVFKKDLGYLLQWDHHFSLASSSSKQTPQKLYQILYQIYLRNTATNKEVLLAKTDKKQYAIERQPSGRYEVFIIAIRQADGAKDKKQQSAKSERVYVQF